MIQINNYKLDKIDLEVCYSYEPPENGDYWTPPRSGYAEVLKVWVESDELKTDIIPLMSRDAIFEIEEHFYEYETDKLFEI